MTRSNFHVSFTSAQPELVIICHCFYSRCTELQVNKVGSWFTRSICNKCNKCAGGLAGSVCSLWTDWDLPLLSQVDHWYFYLFAVSLHPLCVARESSESPTLHWQCPLSGNLASNITMIRYDNINSSVRSENITTVYASYYDTSIGVAFSVLAVLGENILVILFLTSTSKTGILIKSSYRPAWRRDVLNGLWGNFILSALHCHPATDNGISKDD